MKRYSLYVIGFAALVGSGFAADGQEALHRHYAALTAKYAEISGAEEKQSRSVASAASDFCAEEIQNTKAKVAFYRQPLDRIVGALEILLRPIILEQPMHGGMGYGMHGYQAHTPRSLVHFLSAVTEREFVRISFIGSLEHQPQIRDAFMELVSYTSTYGIIAPVGAGVASLEVFINGAVFPTLCSAANAARAFHSEAAAEETALKSQAKLAIMSSMGTPLSAELVTAIKIAKQEQGVLSTLVQKFDEVVEALRRAGRLS